MDVTGVLAPLLSSRIITKVFTNEKKNSMCKCSVRSSFFRSSSTYIRSVFSSNAVHRKLMTLTLCPVLYKNFSLCSSFLISGRTNLLLLSPPTICISSVNFTLYFPFRSLLYISNCTLYKCTFDLVFQLLQKDQSFV